MLFRKNKNLTLQQKIALIFVLLSTLLFVTLGITILSKYEDDYGRISREVVYSNAKLLESASRKYLWNMEYRGLRQMIKDLINDKIILYISFSNDLGKTVVVEGKKTDSKYKETITAKIKDSAGDFLSDMYIEYSTEKIQEKYFQAMVFLVGSIVLIVIVLFTGGHFLLKWIIRPIPILTEAAIEMTKGNLDYPVDIKTKDELGILSDSFVYMRTEIKKQIQKLQQLNAELDERVAKRTEDLRIAFRSLEIEKHRAEVANNAKSEFLANMSHEIRTPMNAVLGFTEIIRARETNPKNQHYLDSIYTSGKTLLALINDVLDLSKIEAGKFDFQYASVSIIALFKEIQSLFEQKSTDKEIELLVDIPKDIEKTLILDENHLRQVLINIVGNAVKFTNNGHIKLSARTTRSDDELHSRVNVEFIIADTGVGIPEEYQSKVFEAFTQVKGKVQNGIQGTGLGLSISKRLIELMGGDITVESKLDEGTTFKISLSDVEISAIEPTTSSRFQYNYDSIIFEPKTILITDDIEYNREILATFLEDWNFEIIFAKNGKETVEKAIKFNPDCILLDIKMPVMDGHVAAKLIKQTHKLTDIKIIAITASALKQDKEEISQICDGYLSKPISKSNLVSMLMKFLPHSLTKPQISQLDEEELQDQVGLPVLDLSENRPLLEELLGKLEEIKRLSDSMDFDSLEDFAKSLNDLAIKFSYSPIFSYISRLQDNIDQFDIDSIQKLLKTLADAINDQTK